jgi:hypothetical protein
MALLLWLDGMTTMMMTRLPATFFVVLQQPAARPRLL